MSGKQFASATVAGAVTFYVLGFLMWGLALTGFFEANTGSAIGVMKDPPDLLMLGIGQLALGALLTLIFGKWATISTAISGMKAGAMIGFLVGLGIDLTLYGTTNSLNLTATLVDTLLVTVQWGVAGAVVGAVLGMTK